MFSNNLKTFSAPSFPSQEQQSKETGVHSSTRVKSLVSVRDQGRHTVLTRILAVDDREGIVHESSKHFAATAVRSMHDVESMSNLTHSHMNKLLKDYDAIIVRLRGPGIETLNKYSRRLLAALSTFMAEVLDAGKPFILQASPKNSLWNYNPTNAI